MPPSTPVLPGRFRPVVAVIPARGGSKGIPRKALAPLGGRPLLLHTTALALRLLRKGWLDRVLVSTEDPGIARAARKAGAEVLDRPRALATDRATGLEVLRHAVRAWGGAGTAVLLQPTSPLRAEEDVVACLRRLARGGIDAAVTVTGAHPPPEWMYRLGAGGRLRKLLPSAARRRQETGAAWALNGAVYAAAASAVLSPKGLLGGRLAGVPMPPERSVDIDTPLDLRIAEALLR